MSDQPTPKSVVERLSEIAPDYLTSIQEQTAYLPNTPITVRYDCFIQPPFGQLQIFSGRDLEDLFFKMQGYISVCKLEGPANP